MQLGNQDVGGDDELNFSYEALINIPQVLHQTVSQHNVQNIGKG